MKNFNFKLIILILYGLFIMTLALSLDITEINNNFKYNKDYNFINSNLILLFGIIALLIKNIIESKNSIEWKKIVLYSLSFLILIEVHLKYTIIFIALNFFISFQLRKNLKSILLTLIIIPTLIGINYLYLSFTNNNLYKACQNETNNELIDKCVKNFSYYSLHTDEITYLTYINKELAKKNEKIKIRIEKNIIMKNKDENCKLNNNYEVPNIKNKEGTPCME